jgi:hypothetical protein
MNAITSGDGNIGYSSYEIIQKNNNLSRQRHGGKGDRGRLPESSRSTAAETVRRLDSGAAIRLTRHDLLANTRLDPPPDGLVRVEAG